MSAAGFDQVLAFFYRPQGRISRAEYALGVALIYALSLAILSFVVVRFDAGPGAILVASLVSLPLTIAYFVLVVKRCHDFGLPGTFLLLLFVPLVNIVWLVALFFMPGNAAPNLYGPPPSFRHV